MTNDEKFQITPIIAVTSNTERYSFLRPALMYHSSLKNGLRIIQVINDPRINVK